MPRQYIRGTTEDRLKAYSDQSGGPESCWVWTGAVTGSGYGYLHVGERYRRAHRVAYEIWVGAIPEGQDIRHTCDNRLCINPRHMLTGTRKENMRDCRERGRTRTGEKHWNAKLTNEESQRIRDLYASGMLQREIATLFCVSQSAVSMVVRGRRRGATYL